MAIIDYGADDVSVAAELNGLSIEMNEPSVEVPAGPAEEMQQADSDASPPPLPSKLFEVKETPNKGLGMFAIDLIPRGTTILEEKPLFILYGQDYLVEEIEAAFAQMMPESKEKYLSLHSIHGLRDGGLNPLHAPYYMDRRRVSWFGRMKARSARVANVVSIFFANSMSAGDDAAVVLHEGSRINHSCVPNASYVWSAELGMERIRSVKDIAAGEVCHRHNVCSTF